VKKSLPRADPSRLQIPDPALMRRAGTRMTVALMVVLTLISPFTIGGVTLLAAGELPGLPLAVGGAVLQMSCIVLVVATVHIRRTLDDRTIARSALLAARQVTAWTRRTAVATILTIILFGLVRLAFEDRWSLGTACIMSIGLFFLANGSKNMRRAQELALTQTQ
jgi:hypothetical protein